MKESVFRMDSILFIRDLLVFPPSWSFSPDDNVSEKDSILFYYGMKERMPKGVHPTLNKVIAEEELHLRQLSDFKKQLTE